MANNIDIYLRQIRTALYGKQVRSAIADGIEECYNRDISDNPLVVRREMLADEFAANENYSKGQLIFYEGDIYEFTADHPAGEWTGNDAEITPLAEAIYDIYHEIEEKLSVEYATKADTILTTTLSRGRKADTTVGFISFAFGNNIEASGACSFAIGNATVASGMCAYAEGNVSSATAQNSHAEGSRSNATGTASHAECFHTTASGEYSHAEGNVSVSSGYASHAEGSDTEASAYYSHSEGRRTTASGTASHAEGINTEASGESSHAEGSNTISNHRAQHVFGECNIADNNAADSNIRGTYVEIVGNGADTNNRSNARTLDWSGNEELAGDLVINKGTVNQVSVSTMNSNIATLQQQVEDLLYVPIAFNSCTVSPSSALIGTTVSSVTISWGLNKAPITLKLNGTDVSSDKVVQSSNIVQSGTWTATTSFSMIATDERSTSASSSASLTFMKNVYYGVATLNASPDSNFIIGLSNAVLTNTKKRSITVNCGTNNYVYYAVPKSGSGYGACSFSVGGFSGGFEPAVTVSVTYPDTSHTENYYLYRSTNHSLGSTTIAVT